MPTTASPEKLLEVAIGRILQRSHGVDLDAVTRASRSRLDPARLWALIQVYRYASVTGTADLDAIADERRVPRQILEPTFDRLVAGGYATSAGGAFSLTAAGAAEVNSARDVVATWITEMLAQSTEFEGRPDRLQVQGALDRLARSVLLERRTPREETRPMKIGAPPRPPVSDLETTRMRSLSAPPMASPRMSDPPTRPFRPRAAMPPAGAARALSGPWSAPLVCCYDPETGRPTGHLLLPCAEPSSASSSGCCCCCTAP